MAPFVIDVNGRAEIPHPAERALIHVQVGSSGANKAAVSEEVLTTARHIEDLLRELSPRDQTPEAKKEASLAHWSKSSLTSTSYVPYDYLRKTQRPREYSASVKFDIRFKEFKALGDFGGKLSALSHVEVTGIDWILTAQTEKSYRSLLRKEAARDALQKARDYCEVLGCSNIRPVGLEEGQGFTRAIASTMQNSNTMQQQAPSYQQAQCAPGYGQMTPGNNSAGACARDESPLEFRAEEVRMALSVRIKFEAECVSL